MSKSSLDYAELSGLTIALRNLEAQGAMDDNYSIVTTWIQNRIKTLQNK